jgi:predicted nucleotidyltransferase
MASKLINVTEEMPEIIQEFRKFFQTHWTSARRAYKQEALYPILQRQSQKYQKYYRLLFVITLLQKVITMETTIKILKLLLDKKEEKFTIRRIAKALKINYRTGYESVMLLEKDGLLKITRLGNSNVCELAYGFDSKVFEAELLRRCAAVKNKDLLVLYNRLAELKFPFVALLFGSHAKGTAGKHSDIDLLAVGGDEKEIKATVSLLPDKIHLAYVDYNNFIHMAQSREFTVVSEAMKGNIILIGIEEYYRLLKNAGLEADKEI